MAKVSLKIAGLSAKAKQRETAAAEKLERERLELLEKQRKERERIRAQNKRTVDALRVAYGKAIEAVGIFAIELDDDEILGLFVDTAERARNASEQEKGKWRRKAATFLGGGDESARSSRSVRGDAPEGKDGGIELPVAEETGQNASAA
jgi:hypothetical protein